MNNYLKVPDDTILIQSSKINPEKGRRYNNDNQRDLD